MVHIRMSGILYVKIPGISIGMNNKFCISIVIGMNKYQSGIGTVRHGNCGGLYHYGLESYC